MLPRAIGRQSLHCRLCPGMKVPGARTSIFSREAWRQSWLEVFAEGAPLAPELLDWLHSQNHSAHAVMSAPVITVSEDTELDEIARVLVTHRIKRVPVVRDDRVTGIIPRGDLLRALAANKADL